MQKPLTKEDCDELQKLLGVVKEKQRQEKPFKNKSQERQEVKVLSELEKNISSEIPGETLEELEPPSPLPVDQKYIPLDFADPVELLFYIDDTFATGQRKLYNWQIDSCLLFAQTGYTTAYPLDYILLAANSSGKDSFVNSICALWHCVTKIRSRFVGSSSSYIQMKNQTGAYTASLANRLNAKLILDGAVIQASGDEKDILPLSVKRDHIICNLTSSEIVFFVTDDAGRAEGWHPFPDYPGSELCILLNEAKSIRDEIYEAFRRCTFNRFLEVSSSGGRSGFLYKNYQRAVIYPKPYDKESRYARKVTSYDCEHVSKRKIKEDIEEFGINSPIVRSKHFSEFTSSSDPIVVTLESYEACINAEVEKVSTGLGLHAGLDLAAGGDENTLYVFDENIYIGHEAFRAEDTSKVTCELLMDFFRKYKLEPSKVWADDGGVSHGILDNLADHHNFSCNRVRNQSGAILKRHYGNRGAELYFNFARFIQEKVVQLPKENVRLKTQMTSRYYRQAEGKGTLLLESKKEAKANGHPSPDHADAAVLAFCGLDYRQFSGAFKKDGVPSQQGNRVLSLADLVKKEREKELMRNFSKTRTSNSRGQNKTVSGILRKYYANSV